jgi:hypothetical protein
MMFFMAMAQQCNLRLEIRYYCCVGCEAHSSHFNDLAYCFRAHCLTLAEWQEFMLQGEPWKHTQVNLLDNLKIAQLQTELEKRGYNTRGKKTV